MAGKGDKPRPVDPEKWADYFKRTGQDYCRFNHKHDETCVIRKTESDYQKSSDSTPESHQNEKPLSQSGESEESK